MTQPEILAIIRALPPGARVEIRKLPDSTTVLRIRLAGDAAMRTAEQSECKGDLAPTAEEAPQRPHSPLQIALRIGRDIGADHTEKLGWWAEQLRGISARELERAASVGALAVIIKTRGRDNKAKLISAGAMIRYLELRERAIKDPQAAPAWASHVWKGIGPTGA